MIIQFFMGLNIGQGRERVNNIVAEAQQQEAVFVTQKLADRLMNYANKVCGNPSDRIFQITYERARSTVRKAGEMVNVNLRPHDLRRHSATCASRSGAPIEIVSKIILRHSDLSSTQEYLRKISDTKAARWIETLYAQVVVPSFWRALNTVDLSVWNKLAWSDPHSLLLLH